MSQSVLYFLLVCLSFRAFAQEQTDEYSFFVAGHTYGAPGVDNVGFHPPFKEMFPYIQGRSEIEFGVLNGDIVSPFPIAQDWDEIDADIELLGLPVYFAVGNHDMENRPLFEARYGDTFYDFTYNNDLFIMLDPNIDGWSITGDQLFYLESVVNEQSPLVENIFVFFHQILWREPDFFNHIFWNSDAGRIDPVNFWSAVMPIFSPLPNKVTMMAGDLGAPWSTIVSYDRYHNIELIATGMGRDIGDNFIVVNVETDKSVNYDLICMGETDTDCLGELTDYLTVDILTSLSEQVNVSANFISPNPADRYISVSAREKSILRIFDISGNVVIDARINELSEYRIDVSHLQSCIYVAKLQGKSQTSTQKLML